MIAHAGGRPKKFNSPAKLQKLIDAYYEDCDAREVPYTIEGLAYACDCDRKTITNYAKDSEFFLTIKRAREKGGPTLIEIKTYRYKGHSISDPQKYRTKDEVDEYRSKDPIEMVLHTILKNNFATKEEIAAIDKRVDDIVVESVKFAEESPWPDDSEVLKDIYVDKNYPFIVD